MNRFEMFYFCSFCEYLIDTFKHPYDDLQSLWMHSINRRLAGQDP